MKDFQACFYWGFDKLREWERATQRELIQAALRETKGNCAKAAKLLGINRETLVMRRKSLGLPIKGSDHG